MQNNDNATGKQNYVTIDATFGNSDYIDMVFTANDSQGTSEYQFEIGVMNATPDTWVSFHFVLGFRTGNNFTENVSGLDFDTPHRDPTPFHSPTRLSMLYHEAWTLDWLDGPWQPNQGTIFYMMIDVPDAVDPNIPEVAKIPGGYRFTLRAVPGVFNFPNPGGMMAPGQYESLEMALLWEQHPDSLSVHDRFASPAHHKTVDVVPPAFAGHRLRAQSRPPSPVESSIKPEGDWLDLTQADTSMLDLDFIRLDRWHVEK
jgi:hypothetical protein